MKNTKMKSKIYQRLNKLCHLYETGQVSVHITVIPRLHSELLCRRRCLQWYNGSLITRYQWSVTDASYHSSQVACG